MYYCSNADAYSASPSQPRVAKCIVEVTNTPWGERVTFVLPGDGMQHSVRKSLHVSPLMDMEATWWVDKDCMNTLLPMEPWELA